MNEVQTQYLSTPEQVIKDSCSAIGLSFLSVNIFEANLELDFVKDVEFPVCVIIQPQKEKSKQIAPQTLQRTVNIFGFILYKIQQGTSDIQTEVTKPIVHQARLQLDRLVRKLNNHEINDDNGIDVWETNEVYGGQGEFDSNLHGVQFSFDWVLNDTLPYV